MVGRKKFTRKKKKNKNPSKISPNSTSSHKKVVLLTVEGIKATCVDFFLSFFYIYFLFKNCTFPTPCLFFSNYRWGTKINS